MSLADMTWKRVAIHEVVAEFLRSEPHRLAGMLSPASAHRLMPMIKSPNFDDTLENHARLRLLFLTRRQLIGEIPPDTRWYEVRNLTDNELPELHVIARCGWDAPRGTIRTNCSAWPRESLSGCLLNRLTGPDPFFGGTMNPGPSRSSKATTA
jgi:hypothetical protein